MENLETAVREAAARAEEGDIVIMSPASASFDRFKNFMERGNLFKSLVQALRKMQKTDLVRGQSFFAGTSSTVRTSSTAAKPWWIR